MKILIINGSPKNNGNTARALAEAELTELELTKEITDTGVTVTVSYGCIREIAVPLR